METIKEEGVDCPLEIACSFAIFSMCPENKKRFAIYSGIKKQLQT